MILILISLIASVAVAWLLFWHADKHYGWTGHLAAIAGVLIAVGAGFGVVSYAFTCWNWIASESKAQIINREYGTNYTREEIFFASSVIDTIREIDRKRVEINGDVMRDAPDRKR